MLENLRIDKLNHTDLNMYQCGHEDCSPGHSFGPAVRDHFLIHFIHSGKGNFYVDNKTYSLSACQGFLILPGIVTFYEADKTNPWSYSWVGFHGLKAEQYLKRAGLTLENPIFSYTKDHFVQDCLSQMLATKQLVKSKEIRLIGLLYQFLSLLIEESTVDPFMDSNENRKELYVKQVIKYIEMNYSRKITVEEISYNAGLDRSYLGSIFKEIMSISIKEFLIRFRINKACELMENPILSIGDISRSVGYEDPLLFSKIFKQEKGLSPKHYRKKNI